ncbi:MAG: hypothetical protein M5U31_09815 [Acidimicrobiia bacterium]|nr:hypothetical protein [Acidimicrobiia bacterium]
MGLKTGLVVGFAVGYYLGAKAGRERYEQIRELLAELGDRQPLEMAQALVELGAERLRGAPDALVVRGPDTAGASGSPGEFGQN